MTMPNEQLNNEHNQWLSDETPEDPNQLPANVSQAPIDSLESAKPQMSPPVESIQQVEVDPLEGFNPDDYKAGLEGDERYRILDLLMGYLVGRNPSDDPIKLRHALVKWDNSNRPPLGIMAIHAHIKANHTKWCRHHYLCRTGTWAGIK